MTSADDVAAHHALAAALPRLGGVLELLAYRNAMAERDQSVEIFVGAMDRHAAHRDVAAEMLAALGEHDAERARGDLGVLEEQFVEIAHPVEQEAIRIGGLDLDELLHHRRGARGALGGRGGFETGGNIGRAASMARATLADGAAGFMGRCEIATTTCASGESCDVCGARGNNVRSAGRERAEEQGTMK